MRKTGQGKSRRRRGRRDKEAERGKRGNDLKSQLNFRGQGEQVQGRKISEMGANMLAWWQISWCQTRKTVLGKRITAIQKKKAKIAVLIFSQSVLWVFVKSMVLSFSANLTKRPTGVRKKENKRDGLN